MAKPLIHFLNSIGSPEIYLDRHFPNRLSISELKELSLDRIKAYNKKHKSKRYQYKNETYNYSIKDLEGNSYWGTDIEIQYNNYFTIVYNLIKEKNNINNAI
jgi:hypothetical protein